MWEPNGKTIDARTLGELHPEEVLFEFEEPLTFTCRGCNGQMLLAHSLCAKRNVSRYLVVVTNRETIGELKAGRLEVLAALRQPRCWIVDFGPGWIIQRLWRVTFEEIPDEMLPEPHATLPMDLRDDLHVPEGRREPGWIDCTELAIDRGVRKFVTRAQKAGLLPHFQPAREAPSVEELFEKEAEESQ
jgi:hypothetical protein